MNQAVFGTEMVLTTFIAIIVQVLAIFVQVGVVITTTRNRSNWRFLLLIFLFINYNLCSGLFPDRTIEGVNLLLQNILAFSSGIILACYYFYFLVKEIEINQGKIFNMKVLTVTLLVSFFLLYIVSYLIYSDFNLARRIFIIPPVVIGLYFCFHTVVGIRKKSISDAVEGLYRSLHVAGKLGIAFMATMPIVVAFGDFQLLNNGLVNISFILVWIAYYILLHLQSTSKQQLSSSELERRRVITELGLTPRELEIAFCLLQGKNYNDLAQIMYISHKTVSKHASNIFKKADCCTREEFIIKYLND